MGRLLLIGSMLVALVAASAPPPHAAAPTPTLAGPPAPVLGVSFRNRLGTLAWFDPLTLQPLRGRKAPLAGHVGSHAFSDDRSLLAIGSWDVPELRFINARTMRVLGDLRLEQSGGHGVGPIVWLRPDRLLASLTHGANGKEREIYRAAGLRFVDTQSWPARTVDQGASDVVTAGELVLATGGSYDSATTADRSQGIGIVAYDHDGRERWRLHPGENRWLQPAAGFGYVYLDGTHVEIVHLATGTVVRALRRQGIAWPVLVLGNSID